MNKTVSSPASDTAPVFFFAAAAAVFFVVFVIGNTVSGNRIVVAAVAGFIAVLWMLFLWTRHSPAAQASHQTFGMLSDEKVLEKLLDSRRR